MAHKRSRDVALLLRSVPRDLLLLLKTDDCLRSLEFRLNAPLNTVAITARACTRARAELRSVQQRGWTAFAAAAADRLGVETRILLMSLAVWWQRVRGSSVPAAPV